MPAGSGVRSTFSFGTLIRLLSLHLSLSHSCSLHHVPLNSLDTPHRCCGFWKTAVSLFTLDFTRRDFGIRDKIHTQAHTHGHPLWCLSRGIMHHALSQTHKAAASTCVCVFCHGEGSAQPCFGEKGQLFFCGHARLATLPIIPCQTRFCLQLLHWNERLTLHLFLSRSLSSSLPEEKIQLHFGSSSSDPI